MPTPTLTAPPAAPSRLADSEDTYVTKADAFVAWWVIFAGQLITAVSWIADQVTTTVASAIAAAASALAAAASATAAVAATGYVGTSTANLAVGTGAKAVTGLAGKSFANGKQAVLIYRPDGRIRMRGLVSLADMVAGTMTVTVASAADFAGSGTYADWMVIDAAFESLPHAPAADLLLGTSKAAAMTPGDTYDALAEVTLTDASTIAVDMATFINAAVTLGGNRTLGNPTNAKPGQTGDIRSIQDGTGSRTLAFAANWKRTGGAPTLTTTAGAIDIITYKVKASNYVHYEISRNPS